MRPTASHITIGLLFWPSFATILFIIADWLRYGGAQ
jgi:hypothetical protein